MCISDHFLVVAKIQILRGRKWQRIEGTDLTVYKVSELNKIRGMKDDKTKIN